MAVTLKGKVGLNVRQAEKNLRTLKMRMNKFHRSFGKPMLTATRNLARMGMIAATVGVAFTAMALKVAGSFDQLHIRLKTALGSAIEAKKAFAETFELFVKSPMDLRPLIEARVLLESLGITGPKALKQVADASAIMGREVTDVALALGSMKALPLRRLGIDAKKAGDSFKFAFRDKAGNAVKMVATGLEDARRKVLDIFSIKFGGGLAEMAKTFPGAMSTLRGAGSAALKDFIDPLKNQLLPNLIKLNDWVIESIQSGRFKKWGDSFNSAVTPMIARVNAIIKAFNALTGAERDQLTNVLTIATAFVVAWRAGFIKPILAGLNMILAGNAKAMGAMILSLTIMLAKAIAVGVVFFMAFKAGKALANGFKDGFADSFDAEFGVEQIRKETEAIKKLFSDPKSLLPKGFQDLIAATFGKLPETADLPDVTNSGEFKDDVGNALNGIREIANLARPIRGMIVDPFARGAAERAAANGRGEGGVQAMQKKMNDNLETLVRQGGLGGVQFAT